MKRLLVLILLLTMINTIRVSILSFDALKTQYNRQAVWSALPIQSESVQSSIANAMQIVTDADLPVILAICKIESTFNPHAISRRGCLGLMQVNPRIWPDILPDWHNPTHNVAIGYGIYKHYLALTGDVRTALNRYSGDRSGRYAKRVMAEANHVRSLLQPTGKPQDTAGIF